MGDDPHPAESPPADDFRQRAEALVGTIISQRYRVETLIACGGMGAVYRGEHVLMRKRIAIKVLQPGAANLPQLVERFRREAIVGAHVDHPNIASATDFGQLDDGSYFLVLEHIKGRTLSELLKAEGRLGPERAAGIARQVALGLHAVHSAGVIHRDIKPQNVMLVETDANRTSSPAMLLGRDVVKIIDFGFALVIEERMSITPSERQSIAPGRITQQGEVFGTIAYLAPEASEGMDAVDARSDLYALGVVMYQMLAGVHPFTETEPAELFRAHMRKLPPPIAVRAPGVEVPPELEAIVMRLLDKVPASRFQTGLELVAAIDEAMGVSSIASLGGFHLTPTSLPPDLLAEAASLDRPAASARGVDLPPPSVIPPTARVPGEAPPSSPPRSSSPSARPGEAQPGEAQLTSTLVPAELPPSSIASDTSSPGSSLSAPGPAPAAGPRPSRAWLGGVAAGLAVAVVGGVVAISQGVLHLTPAPATSASAEPPAPASAEASAPEPEPPSPPPPVSSASPREVASWKLKLKAAAQKKNWSVAKTAFYSLAEQSPATLSEPQILPGVTDLVANMARHPGPEVDGVFDLLENKTGAAGLDVLYELVQMRGGTLAAEQATEILKNPQVLARATPAVRVAFELRIAPCDKKAELFERAAAEGDLRMHKVFDLVRSSCGSSLALEQARANLRARLRGAPRR